jgi:hypothetical protein
VSLGGFDRTFERLEANAFCITHCEDAISALEVAAEDRRCQWRFDHSPDRATHRTRTELGIVSTERDERLDRARIHGELDALSLAELLDNTCNHATGDFGDFVTAEPTEEQWFVDTVPKLGGKRATRSGQCS